MQPTEVDIKWCVEHKDFVNALLEKRGGAQHGDWFYVEGYSLNREPVNIASWEEADMVYEEMLAGDPDVVWILTEGDALLALAAARTWPDMYGDTAWDRIELLYEPDHAVDAQWSARYVMRAYGEDYTGILPSGNLGECRNAATPLIALLELLREAQDA